MPVMDGCEAIRQIKATDKGSRVPIIALTAHAFNEDQKRSIEAGADSFMSKPLRYFELFAAIERHLAVHYEYEEEGNSAKSVEAGEIASISAKILAGLPEETVNLIRQSILTANLTLLLNLIDQIEQQPPQVADWLRELANNYEFDQIMVLLAGEKAEGCTQSMQGAGM